MAKDTLNVIYEKIAAGTRKVVTTEVDAGELVKLLNKNPLQTVKQFNAKYNMELLLVDYVKSLGDKAKDDQDLQLAIMSLSKIINKMSGEKPKEKEEPAETK